MEAIEKRLLLSFGAPGADAGDSTASASGPYVVADGIPNSNSIAIGTIPAVTTAGATPAIPNHLVITPDYTAINGQPNAANIEAVIDQAINEYQTHFADPITVQIAFKEMTGGLGTSQWAYWNLSYDTVISRLTTDATTVDDSTALAHLPSGTTNPVNGSTNINIKTANIRALGIPGFPSGLAGGVDGIISLNTHITDVGSPGTTGQFSLIATVEHEIDEVLGLGSALVVSGSLVSNDPLPEDLFRYDSGHSRSFIKTGDDAYFSIDASNNLARFNQGNNAGGDYGDWWSNNGSGNPGPTPPPRVQDAVQFAGTHAILGSEWTALDVIGYTPLLGSIAGSNIRIVKDVGNPIYADVTIDGGSMQQWPISQLPAIWGTNGDDTLTVDFSKGNPFPVAGISYDGGAGVNTVSIIGTTAADTLTAGSGGITFANGTFGSVPITVANVQSLQFVGGSGGADAVNITDGTYTLDAGTASGNPNVSVTVGSGANVTFTGDQHLAGLAINDGVASVVTASRKTINAGVFSIGGDGKLDIGGNNLIAKANTGVIRGYLQTSLTGNLDWSGSGITSSVAAGNPATYTIGYGDSTDGVTQGLTAGQVLVRSTVYGDATLDGITDLADFGRLSAHFGALTGARWVDGDFNYDGLVDLGDFGKLSANYGGVAAAPGAAGAAVEAVAGPVAAASSVSSIPPAVVLDGSTPPSASAVGGSAPQAGRQHHLRHGSRHRLGRRALKGKSGPPGHG